MNSSSVSSQPAIVLVNPTCGSGSVTGPITAVPTPPMTYPPNAKSSCPEEDAKKPEWEPEFRETFSKSILNMRLKEYWGGKSTQRYIETYLDFMHLSGMLDNLEWLEYKNALGRGQL